MSKMNRRNYLKQMAIGAAAVSTSGFDVLGQTAHHGISPNEITAKSTATLLPGPPADHFPNWPDVATRPQTPPVLFTFHGLLDVYYNSSGSHIGLCGIGFHRGANPNDPSHHRPVVSIFENGAPMALEASEIQNPHVRIEKVNVSDPHHPVPQPPDVKFLKNNLTDDIRWLIDMQSPLWYPRAQTQSPGNYSARLLISHGTFFTLTHTCYRMNQVVVFDPQGDTQDGMAPIRFLGHPADHIAGATQLGANEKIRLEFNGNQTRLLPMNAGSRYEVRFSNMCEDVGQPECQFDWRDRRREEKINDFHHHRRTLNLGPNVTRYSVALAEEPDTGDFCQTVGRNTNEAPCMNAGYGSGNGPN